MEDLYIGNIEIGGEVDGSGEICIDMNLAYEYINKDQAKKIIEHLQNVFNLKEVSDDPS